MPDLVRAHHGSIAREQRLEIEDDLKAGGVPALVAPSSLELGIDMGAIDLVIQVEAPTSVASGLQRIGRAGHQVGQPSRGRIFPKFRHDLLVAAVVARRMHAGQIEETSVPRNPLDVLAQHIVAMVAVEDRPVPVDEVAAVVAAGLPVRRPEPDRPRRRPGHALRALPERRVRRAAAPAGLGPTGRDAHRPAGRQDAGRHQRRHHPRPRPVRRVHPRGGPGGRARRGDGL